MKQVLIDNLEGGEILAREVFDKQGTQLLPVGATYKPKYSKILHNLKINHLYIKEDSNYKELDYNNKKEFNVELLRTQSRNIITKQLERFDKVGSINIYKFEKLVYTIINELMESDHVIQNMYTIREYSYYTYEHSVHVTIIAIMICNKLNLSRYKTYEIAMGCILHDLGKTRVPKEILNKPDILTEEEFDEIKEHPKYGYHYIKYNRNLTPEIKEIILFHHEKLDGSGYPLGIAGNDISLGARICTVADVFDAICSERPYKKAMPLPEGVRIIKATMNKQLDMDICTILEEILSSTEGG